MGAWVFHRRGKGSGGEGVQPAQRGKPGKVAVGGAEREAVLHGECGEMRIRNEIGVYAGGGKQFAERTPMTPMTVPKRGCLVLGAPHHVRDRMRHRLT